MRGWVTKEAAIQATKSLWIKGWLAENFNVFVPCSIQYNLNGELPEKVSCRFIVLPPKVYTAFSLQIPINAIRFEHKLLRQSIPFRHWTGFKKILEDLTT